MCCILYCCVLELEQINSSVENTSNVEILVVAREYCSRGTCTLPLKIKSFGRLLKVSLFMCRLSLLI